MGRPRIELTGRKFGKLTVIRCVGKNSRDECMWECQCDCGKQISYPGSALNHGRRKSCGCLRHHLGSSQFYDTWAHLKARCLNPLSQSYKNYGGRGISVCERWLRFENFRDDMLSSYPGKGWSIERDDVDGIYEPQNCKWIPKSDQARNLRKTVRCEIGQQIGAWEVISEPEWGIKRGTAYRCRCICGVERFVRAYMLKNGTSRSCGCIGSGKLGLMKVRFIRTQKLLLQSLDELLGERGLRKAGF